MSGKEINGVEIRKASIDDIAKLAAYRVGHLDELFDHTEDEDSMILMDRMKGFLEKHFESGDMLCYLALSSGNIVGSACMMVRETPPVYDLFDNGKLGYLMNIHTSGEFTGQGITKELVERVISEARGSGIEYIHLHCNDDRTRFYSKLGFSEVLAHEMKMELNRS